MKPTIHSVGRRRFLVGAGATTLTLPLLPSLEARAQSSGQPPLRFVVVGHSIGTLVDRWRPTGYGQDFTLPDLLSPLQPFQSDMQIISGVDNQMSEDLKIGSEVHHASAAHALFTGAPMEGMVRNGRRTGFDAGEDAAPPTGPSIDQIVADRLSAQGGVRRSIHLSAGPSRVGEYRLFWRKRSSQAQAEYMSNNADPAAALSQLFANATTGPSENLSFEARLRNHAGSILDSVRESYGRLERSVPPEDRLALQSHATMIRELEQDLQVQVVASDECARPQLNIPGQERWFDRVENAKAAAEAQSRIIAMALACDVTRVATLQFSHTHLQRFTDIPNYTVPNFGYGNWHDMVHNDDTGSINDSLFLGFQWYSHRVAYLLSAIKAVQDSGSNLLDNTVVLWASEYGNGGLHWATNIPMVLFGGPLRKGVHIDGRGHSTHEVLMGVAERFGISLSSIGMPEYQGRSYVDNPLMLG